MIASRKVGLGPTSAVNCEEYYVVVFRHNLEGRKEADIRVAVLANRQ